MITNGERMTTALIRLNDGSLVEVDIPDDQVEQIAGGLPRQVKTSIDVIKPILTNICRPIVAAWKELDGFDQGTSVQGAEIEIGLGFEGEGNVYIAKAKTGVNVTVRLMLKSEAER